MDFLNKAKDALASGSSNTNNTQQPGAPQGGAAPAAGAEKQDYGDKGMPFIEPCAGSKHCANIS